MRTLLRFGISALSCLFLLDPTLSTLILLDDQEFPQPHPIESEYSEFESLVLRSVGELGKIAASPDEFSNKFKEEVRLQRQYYLDPAWDERSKIVTIKSRDTCTCLGETMSPCPASCLYSCVMRNYNYVRTNEWFAEDNCRNKRWDSCRCDYGSDVVCNQDMENCLNVSTRQESSRCSKFIVNEEDLINLFDRESVLLAASLNKHFRSILSLLESLKQTSSAIATSSFFMLHISECSQEEEENCVSETNQALALEKTAYEEMKSKIASKLMKTPSLIHSTAQSIYELKEKLFAKINRSIKDYNCCLNDQENLIEGYDCKNLIESGSNQTQLDQQSTKELSSTTQEPQL